MELILWRHADAEVGPVDLKRNLTDKGRRQAERMAHWLRPRLEGDWLVLASPAARARQTADALDVEYDVRPALEPLETEDALLREIGWPANPANVIVVGHQPTLGRVAARLLSGRRGDLSIRKGAIWWFTGRLAGEAGPGETLLRAVMAPDLVE